MHNKVTVGNSLTKYLSTASILCYQIDHPLCLHHLKKNTNDDNQNLKINSEVADNQGDEERMVEKWKTGRSAITITQVKKNK